MNYYNEFDPKAAEWLRQLIKKRLIPGGIVDERSITDIRANELLGYTQCHFFAGIGGWSLALQLAGWPEDRPVWTGSCPCQPFSTAGKRKAFDDERDLWPVFFELIKKAKPKVVFGEQVASSEVVGSSIEAAFVNAVREGDFARANKIASQLSRSPTLHYYSRWVDRVYTDMETSGYAMRTEVLGAHSVGAPHQRQRLYWRGALLGGVAENSNGRGCGGRGDADYSGSGREVQAPGLGDDCGMADTGLLRQEERQEQAVGSIECCEVIGMADSDGERFNRKPVSEKQKRNDITKIMRNGKYCIFCDEWYPETSWEWSDGKCPDCGMSDAEHKQRQGSVSGSVIDREAQTTGSATEFAGLCEDDQLEHSTSAQSKNESKPVSINASYSGSIVRSLSNFPWQSSIRILCRDNKVRRVPAESLLFGVADGLSCELDGGRFVGISDVGGFPLATQKEGRPMLLKGYGNAIVPQVAAEWVMAFDQSAKEMTDELR